MKQNYEMHDRITRAYKTIIEDRRNLRASGMLNEREIKELEDLERQNLRLLNIQPLNRVQKVMDFGNSLFKTLFSICFKPFGAFGMNQRMMRTM